MFKWLFKKRDNCVSQDLKQQRKEVVESVKVKRLELEKAIEELKESRKKAYH